MKKYIVLTAVVLIICFAACACAPVNNDADGDGKVDIEETEGTDVDEMMEMDEVEQVPAEEVTATPLEHVSVTGTVDEVTSTENSKMVTLTNESEDSAYSRVTASVSDSTLFMDAVGGKSSFDKVGLGNRIYVVTGIEADNSNPPIMDARLIMTPAEGGNDAYPHYAHVSDVETEDGTMYIMNSNGDVILCIDTKMEIERFDSEEGADIADIKEDTELVAWYDSVTLSDPAKANPTRVMILPAK